MIFRYYDSFSREINGRIVNLLKPDEKRLLDLLQADAREPISSLARKLGVARSTVQSWIERLEQNGTIAGYTVRLGQSESRRRVRAHLMVDTHPDHTRQVERAITGVAEVRTLHAISGTYDMIAELEADGTEEIDSLIDRIRDFEGVQRTTTSIILATRFDR